MDRIKTFLRGLATVLVSILFTLIVLEIVLRFLPVRSGLETQPIDAVHPTMHFAPDADYVFSNGALLTDVNRGHVNHDGFVNDQDYDRDDKRPLLAVIGDSFIEAAMVPFPRTLEARLGKESRGRIYSFAAAGASLADYLHYSGYVRENFRAGWLVVNVVGNDFDEMLLRYKSAPGFHYYAEKPDGGLTLVLRDYRPSTVRRWLRHSALARYLFLNIGQTPFGARLIGFLQGNAAIPPPPADAFGNTAATPDAERLVWSKKAVDQVLSDFPPVSGLDPAHILFLVDSFRVFDEETLSRARRSYFGIMREYFIAEARRRGFEVADLQEWFARRYARDGAKFEFPDDAHWNATGHEEAANAVLASALWRDFASR